MENKNTQEENKSINEGAAAETPLYGYICEVCYTFPALGYSPIKIKAANMKEAVDIVYKKGGIEILEIKCADDETAAPSHTGEKETAANSENQEQSRNINPKETAVNTTVENARQHLIHQGGNASILKADVSKLISIIDNLNKK